MKITEQARQFVESECKKPTSKYGYEPYPFHFVPMVKYALELGKKLNADPEVIEIASWLHDIGSIINGRADHHITGAEIAERKLREWGYNENKINLIKKCILNHRGSQENKRISIEEKIIAEADAMSNFDNIGGLFKAALMYENLNQIEAQKSVKKKLENKWHKLHFKESKQIIKPKYGAAMTLLS